MTEISTDEIRTDLYYRNVALGYLVEEANSHQDNAARMRYLATALTNTVQPLRTVFNPIRALHTIQTWEGQAATASRNRLDSHEHRHSAAIRGIDNLIDDLEAEAAVVEQRRSATLGEINDIRWQMHLLEQQLLQGQRLEQ